MPGCPGWTVADLVAHLDGVYRWVCLIVGERRSERPPRHERAALDLTETELRRIARAARERVLAEHTAMHRAIELEHALESCGRLEADATQEA